MLWTAEARGAAQCLQCTGLAVLRPRGGQRGSEPMGLASRALAAGRVDLAVGTCLPPSALVWKVSKLLKC